MALNIGLYNDTNYYKTVNVDFIWRTTRIFNRHGERTSV